MGARSTPNTYSPSSGDKLIPGAAAIHEFFGFTADCGEASAEIIYSWAHGEKPTGEHINAVVNAMARLGLASPNGVSSLQGNSKYLAQNEGIPNTVTNDWLGAIQQNAGSKPVEILVEANSLGSALPGDEYGVHGHFLTIEGWSPSHNAYIASDPDNAAAKLGQMVYYTQSQLAAANPVGAIVPVGGGPGITGTGTGTSSAANVSGDGNPIQTFWQDFQSGVQAVLGTPGRAAQAATDSVTGTLLSAAKTALIDSGFFILALGLIAFGILLVFWEPAQAAAKETMNAAGEAAKAAPLAMA